MLNWLKHFWDSATGSVGSAISSAVHWAMHAVASVFLSVFHLVGSAWGVYLKALHDELGAGEWLARETWSFASWLTRGYLPRLVRWAIGEFDRLRSFIGRVARALDRWVTWLIRKIEATARAITLWVIRHVFDPLKNYADHIWNLLKKWGYTAWWWITHLPNLAEALIFHIAASLEKHAFELAGILGKFFLALFLKNLKRVLILIEDILAAVI